MASLLRLKDILNDEGIFETFDDGDCCLGLTESDLLLLPVYIMLANYSISSFERLNGSQGQGEETQSRQSFKIKIESNA